MLFDIPNYRTLEIENIVFDYNGTLAFNGSVNDKTKEILEKLCKEFNIYVITADTFGSVAEELKEFDLKLKILTSSNHTQEKADFIKELNPDKTAAIGNGNNDIEMVETATLSIAIIGREGCATQTMLHSDIVCYNIDDAIELFLETKRLIATLRR